MKRLFFVVFMFFIVCLPSPVSGHETDQYTVPLDREFADLRFYMSNQIYNRLDSAVDKTNEKIKEAMREKHGARLVKQLQSPRSIAAAVYAEFPSFTYHIHFWEMNLHSGWVESQFPGMMVAYKPAFWIYHHWALIIDPTKLVRLIRTSTIMINGTYMGTDKLSHFFDMGYAYYLKLLRSRGKGVDEADAIERSVHLSTGNNLFFSENRILGGLTTGIRSNGDLAANYVGMRFYQNLTEEVPLKGNLQPPLLVREGESWKLNEHVRPGADLFSVFVSDHFDEALNPNYYMLGMNTIMKKQLGSRCGDLLKWYRDDRGNPLSREQFMNINKELSTYYGEDYGHEKAFDKIISISNICFDDKELSVSAATDMADNETKLASVSGVIRDSHQQDSVILRGVLESTESRDVNSVDEFGRTALWWAARHGTLDDVKQLINDGADINTADIDGETPLYAASRWGHTFIVELLLGNGADANASSLYDLTPLHLAVREVNDDLVKVLLKNGADVNVRDIFGCTPLHDSAAKGSEELVTILLSAGADPVAKDINGTTPLHRAARVGNSEIVKKLLALGADAKSMSLLGRTSLDEAVQGNHDEVVKYLSSH